MIATVHENLSKHTPNVDLRPNVKLESVANAYFESHFFNSSFFKFKSLEKWTFCVMIFDEM
jgi:hypothetical protein